MTILAETYRDDFRYILFLEAAVLHGQAPNVRLVYELVEQYRSLLDYDRTALLSEAGNVAQLVVARSDDLNWMYDGRGNRHNIDSDLLRAREVQEEIGSPPYLYPTVDGGVSIEWDACGGGKCKVDPIQPLLSATEAQAFLKREVDDE